MRTGLQTRFLDLVLSVYLYNEWRGYSQMENHLIPSLQKLNFPPLVLYAIQKHAADERKHFFLFNDWFTHNGRQPFQVGRMVGYFDLLLGLFIGKRASLDFEAAFLPQLFRIIVITEKRGLKQVRSILNWRCIKKEPFIERIFKVIEQDEPDHFEPYEAWLKENGQTITRWKERTADFLIHYTIAVVIIPLLYFNPFLKRNTSLMIANAH